MQFYSPLLLVTQKTITEHSRYHDAVSTIYNDHICKARLPMLSSGCLELATEKLFSIETLSQFLSQG